MMSLSSLTVYLDCQKPDLLPKLIELLKHAPMLEHLRLNKGYNIIDKILDILYENIPNLKHLYLHHFDNLLFVEAEDNLQEYCPLPMNSPVATNLLSFNVTFVYFDEEEIPNDWEVNCVYLIDYICHKYTNIISVTVDEAPMLNSQQHKDIIANNVQKAFCSWKQLKKFSMQPVCLSADTLQAMYDCNVSLEDLVVYVYQEKEWDQLINLAHSKYRDTIHTLTIEDDTTTGFNRQLLTYFIQALNKSDCRMKGLSILKKDNVIDDPITDLNSMILMQVLDYVPSLQKMSMALIATGELTRTTYNQMTYLTDLHLQGVKPLQGDWKPSMLQKHIQDVLYASPLLQSIYLDFYILTSVHYNKTHRMTLDLQRNTKLKSLKCETRSAAAIKVIIQRNRTEWYNTKTGKLGLFIYLHLLPPTIICVYRSTPMKAILEIERSLLH